MQTGIDGRRDQTADPSLRSGGPMTPSAFGFFNPIGLEWGLDRLEAGAGGRT